MSIMIKKSDILRASILIVDDQAANVLLLTQMLRNAGYTAISSTTDSEEAPRLHLENRYDLILLDVQMPGMDGFQVMEHLKGIEEDGYLPVLVITAQPSHKLRALNAGAKDFISKPFDVAEVLIRVQNMLEVRLLHLETKRLYERVLAEQEVSEQLLLNALPPSLGELLKPRPPATSSTPGLVVGSYAEVAMLFKDIVEFTKFSTGASGKVLAGVLSDLSTRFEPGGAGVKKTDVLDNANIAAVGLEDSVANHSVLAAKNAVALTEALDRFNAHSRYKLQVRIGIDISKGPGKGATRRKVTL